MTGWALTIAGVPWIFTTHDMGTLTSSSALWWGGETGVAYANGWLEPPRGTITERARPLDGDLEVSPLSFTLHDASSGGVPLLTSLATLDAINVTSTPLASSMTAAATSATVGDGGTFTSPCFAWINREAVRVTAIAGNVLTVTRGRLGTKAVAHTVDATRALFPEAFTSVPWTTRRKVCLWRVDGTAATLAWVGVAQRAPALGDDGATFAMQCDPLWTVLKSAPVGGELPRTSLVGWSNGASTRTGEVALLYTQWSLGATDRTNVSTAGTFRTREAAFRHHEAAVLTRTTALGGALPVQLTVAGDTATLACEDTAEVFVRIFAPTLRGSVTGRSSERTAGRHQLRVSFQPAPPVVQCFFNASV
ncbi:MAG TPA: hypothetical protein VFV33_13580, partial [Gemmatimonadaceae bacterium]|nr:hypothetical protein [Gemmatimonadaceae bacterium]